MRKSLWIALMFVLALAVPVRAYANPIDSFNSGLDTLLHPNTEVKVENGLPEDYEPQEVDLYGTQETVRALPENPTVSDYITDTVDGYTRVNIDNTSLSIKPNVGNHFLRWFFIRASTGQGIYLVEIAVLLVFVWWGVRKAKQIIWTAFRTGKLNLGTSVKRAWYRRKAKEWYG